MFCVGLFLSYGVALAFRLWPQHLVALDLLLAPAGCVVLLALGAWLERGKARGRSPSGRTVSATT
ncbi:hypothetical protein ACE7GA_14875 [Roseomonas sp. CCTCC AB2023176]|uniref:hypothetical protein n=1 Tax=Roseomonas sp. CCTCC AB2023176 TaxID=3342640 RepID=UPI0035E008B9